MNIPTHRGLIAFSSRNESPRAAFFRTARPEGVRHSKFQSVTIPTNYLLPTTYYLLRRRRHHRRRHRRRRPSRTLVPRVRTGRLDSSSSCSCSSSSSSFLSPATVAKKTPTTGAKNTIIGAPSQKTPATVAKKTFCIELVRKHQIL